MRNVKTFFLECLRFLLTRRGSAACVVFVFSFLFILSRPWSQELHLVLEPGSHLRIKYERADGTELVKESVAGTIVAEHRHASLRPVEITALNGPASFTLNGSSYVLGADEVRVIDEWRSERFRFKPLASMLLTSGVLSILCFLLVTAGKAITEKISALVLIAVLGVFYGLTAPGVLVFDYYVNLETAANFQFSNFTGYFYSGILMSLYQFYPSLSLIHGLNFFVVAGCLLALLADVRSPRQLFIFWVGVALLLFYPGNTNFMMSSNRDVSAMLILGVFFLKLLKHDDEGGVYVRTPAFWFLFTLACALRQEVLYVALIVLPIILFAKRFRLFLGVCVVVLALTSLNNFIFSKMERNIYQSTALINPLSSILHDLYGKDLPTEVDQRLGAFFKNSYLLEHFSPYEIDPYHRGGVNHSAKEIDYDQFRSATLGIILENPKLFLENRWGFVKSMFGLADPKPILGYLEDFHVSRYHSDIVEKLGLDTQTKLRDNSYIEFYGRQLIRQSHWNFSYVIAFILLVIPLCLRHRAFYAVLLVVFLRTLIVVLTSPAPMYKYNFVIWVFACFSLVYVWKPKRIL